MHEVISSQYSSENANLVLAKTLAIITGKWRLQIIYRLAEHKLRYNDLRRSIPGVSEKVLVHELKELVALGFLQRESFQEVPHRVEYSLTEKAQRIMPILHQLTQAVEEFLT